MPSSIDASRIAFILCKASVMVKMVKVILPIIFSVILIPGRILNTDLLLEVQVVARADRGCPTDVDINEAERESTR